MLLNLPASYIALKMGYEAVSTMIIGVAIELVTMFVAFLYLKRIVDFPIRKFYTGIIFPMLLVFVLSAILPGLIRFMLMPESFIRLVVVSLVSVLSTIFFAYTISLNRNEKNMLLNYVKTKLLRK